MEIFEINNLRTRLESGEIIELSNDNDLVQLFFRKSLDGSKQFFIELNAKIISMNKGHRAFRDKVWKLVESRKLDFTDNE
jgi:hypothetical protein